MPQPEDWGADKQTDTKVGSGTKSLQRPHIGLYNPWVGENGVPYVTPTELFHSVIMAKSTVAVNLLMGFRAENFFLAAVAAPYVYGHWDLWDTMMITDVFGQDTFSATQYFGSFSFLS